MNRNKLSLTAALEFARRQCARIPGSAVLARSTALRVGGRALFVAAVLCLAAPSFGGKRAAFDVSDTAWDIDARGSANIVAPGRGSKRQKLKNQAYSIAFHADGTLDLGIEATSYGGTWTQTGKKVEVEIEPLLLETFDAICDGNGLGPNCTTSIHVKVAASSRRDTAQLKFKLAYKLKVRGAPLPGGGKASFRRTDTFRGKAVQALVE